MYLTVLFKKTIKHNAIQRYTIVIVTVELFRVSSHKCSCQLFFVRLLMYRVQFEGTVWEIKNFGCHTTINCIESKFKKILKMQLRNIQFIF